MANLSNINNNFLVTTGGNVLIGQTSAIGSSIFQVTGSVNITGGTTSGLNITTSGTQDTININRAASNDNAMTKYQTASADKWIVGLRNTSDDNFRFYSYGTSSDVLTINQGNGSATFAGTVIGTIARFDTLNNSANSKNLIYRDSSGAKTIVGGGSTPDKIYILDGGNVGIGASLPAEILHIEQDNASPVLLVKAAGQTSSTTPYAKLVLAAGSASGFDTGSNIMGYRTADFSSAAARSSGLKFGVLQNNVAKDAMWITEAQKVGIGTASPDYILTAQGSGVQRLKVVATDPSQHSAGVYFLVKNGGSQVGTGTIATQNNGDMDFYTGSTSEAFRMTISAGGNVGIGTTSPDATLDVHAPSTTAPSLTMGAAAGQIFKNEDSELAFGLMNASPYNVWMQSRFNGNVARSFLINPLGGNVGIGTNSPAAMFDVLAGGSNYESIRIQNSKTANANKQAGITSLNYIGNSTSIFQYATNAGGNTVYYGSADGSFRGITQHSFMISSGADTVSHSTKLKILSNLINSYLDLYLIKGTPTIILEGRNFGNSGAKLQFLGWANTHDNWELGNAMAGQGFQFRASATAGSTNFATVAVINSNTGVYTATSDINKKKDFEDSEIGLKEVMKLKPKLFRMKTENGNSDKHLGFIAQEVKKVIPQAYLEENGENDEKFIGLQDRPIIAALTKAIQELKAEIELLKSK